VVAVLLYAFGLSLGKSSSLFRIPPSASRSQVYSEDWVKKVSASKTKLRGDPEPSEHQVIAVDESVVKCGGGRPVYAWVAVDAYTKQPIWFGVSLTRATGNALRFLRRLMGRRLHVWVTRLHPRISVPSTAKL